MGSGCSNGSYRNSSFFYNYAGSNCTPCNTSCSSGNVNADDVIYTGGNADCISIPANSTLSEIILILAQAICDGAIPDPDYSEYDTACLTNAEETQIITQSQFVESISLFVCTLREDFDEFVDETYATAIETITNNIEAINNPELTSCVSVGIIDTDNLNSVLTKLSDAACDLYEQLDPSSANWDTCYTVNPNPTTIVAGFNAIITMICDLKGLVEDGVVLPTFDNTSSCLPTPGATDTLVATINKIKTVLCGLPEFDYTNISFNCVTSATTLEGVIQNIIDLVSDNSQASVTFDEDYFTVTPLDEEDLCQGKYVTLNTENMDRLVASDADDLTPGTLEDKLEEGTGIDLDFSTTPGKVIISVDTEPTDIFVKADSTDDAGGYLIDKVTGDVSGGVAIAISLDDTTDPVNHTVKISPVIDYDALTEDVLLRIFNSTYLHGLFCTLVNNCSTSCMGPTALVATTNGTDIDLVWTPAANSIGQTVSYREKGDVTWLTTPGLTPSNPQTSTATTATFTGIDVNRVFEFKVTNTCTNSSTIDSLVKEAIVFECIDEGDITLTVGTTTIHADLGTIDTINSVIFTLKDSTGVTTIGTSTSNGPNFDALFSGLTAGTQYNLEYVMRAVVNGALVRSDDDDYLTEACTVSTITTDSDEHLYKLNVQNMSGGNIEIELLLEQDTPSLVVYQSAPSDDIPSLGTLSMTPVPVTGTPNIAGNVEITNNEAFTINYSFDVRNNSNGVVAGSTSASGTILTGATVTFPSFAWGNSVDDYTFTMTLDS